MHLGAVFPQAQIGSDAGAVRAFASAVVELGYDHLLIYDHVVGAIPRLHPGWKGGYTDEHEFHEPMVLFGYLAGIAPGLELVTGILILPQRQTVLVAKQAAEVDVLTGGRLRLGIGVGWNAVEYAALGEDFHRRGKKVEEQIDLLRQLWCGPIEQFSGEFHAMRGVTLAPLPVQRPIPIWMGANSVTRSLERIGRLADGWIVQGEPGEKLDRDVSVVLSALEAAGRDPSCFGIQGRINVASAHAEPVLTALDRWRALGATHVAINTLSKVPPASVDEHIARLEAAAAASAETVRTQSSDQ